jgi:hypothetical protein
MSFVERENEWMKKFVTIEEAKQRLKINCSYGWNFQIYLYTPKNALELDEWANFKEKFKTLQKKYVQELIIKKIHGGIEVWCVQHRSLVIDAIELKKYKR